MQKSTVILSETSQRRERQIPDDLIHVIYKETKKENGQRTENKLLDSWQQSWGHQVEWGEGLLRKGIWWRWQTTSHIRSKVESLLLFGGGANAVIFTSKA